MSRQGAKVARQKIAPLREKIMTENEVAKVIVDLANQVHTTLGPGLLESVYEAALAYDLGRRGLQVERQKPLPVVYENVCLEEGFRADLVVSGLDENVPKQTQDLVLKSLDPQFSLLYIQPTPKRVLINFRIVSGSE